MKVFLDTNIVASAILQQPGSAISQKVLDIIDAGKAQGFISVGSFYTMIYLFDKSFKKNNVEKHRRVELIRHIMDVILEKLTIIEHEYLSLHLSLQDQKFDDLEDSCQYHAAIKAGCDILVTENIRDYARAKGPVTIMPAADFIGIFSV